MLREAVANQFVWWGRVALPAPQQGQWSGESNMRERWRRRSARPGGLACALGVPYELGAARVAGTDGPGWRGEREACGDACDVVQLHRRTAHDVNLAALCRKNPDYHIRPDGLVGRAAS